MRAPLDAYVSMGPKQGFSGEVGREMMAGFVKLASLEDLPPGTSMEVEHDGTIFALFNLDGQVFAIDGICAHQGGPLAEGVRNGPIVTCPWHGWQFDVRTGQNTTFSRVCQQAFEVRIEGLDVLVALP